MPKKTPSILKQILFIFLALFLSVVAYSFYNDYYYNKGILPIGISPKSDLAPELTAAKPFIKEFHNFQGKFKLSSPNPIWDNWDWRNDMIIAQVEEIDVTGKTLGLSFIAPEIEGFPENLVVKVNCPFNETAILDDQMFPEAIGLRVFEHIKIKAIIYSYCTNELCTEIGKACLFRNF